MFKNATLYRMGELEKSSAPEIEEQLAKARFVPCGATQEKSIGWAEPRGFDHGALLESIGGQWILKFVMERKDIPGAVIKLHVEDQVKKIEEQTGRKPGRREIRELKDSVRLALLPSAFPKRTVVTIWIDPDERMVVVDSVSRSVLDDVTTHLAKTLDGFVISHFQTAKSSEVGMAEWLLAGAVNEKLFFYGECELKAVDESKAAVKYSRHRLDIEEIQQHIRAGKRPQSLAMTWNGSASFTLNTAGQLKKIKLLDMAESASAQDDDPFDADVAIMTGTLGELIPDLVEMLGGELVA